MQFVGNWDIFSVTATSSYIGVTDNSGQDLAVLIVFEGLLLDFPILP